MNEAMVAEALLNLNGLRAKITVPNMLRTMNLSSRGPHATAAKAIVKEWADNGWLNGDAKLGYKPTPEGVGIIRRLIIDEPWMKEAEELIEKVGIPTLPEIRWKEEFKHHKTWFKAARWPFLKDSRFYLRGINKDGGLKPTTPPEDGWLEGEMPTDWVPLEL